MARQEEAIRPHTETGDKEGLQFLYFDPEELLRHNPAGQIVNIRSIQQMEGKFVPDLFHPLAVARVATHEGEVEYLVCDGLNRLYYAASHKNDTFPEKPGFTLNPVRAYDATDAYLANPAIVRQSEHPAGLNALTLQEYVRAVLPTTAVHVEIAPQRIAAHLIRAWGNIVGVEVANRFSLLAALEYLDSGRRERVFFADQTPQDAEAVAKALRELNQLLSEHRISSSEVKRDAFMLVANQSQIIGGERVALREVQGLIYHPVFAKKIRDQYPLVGDQERLRAQFGEEIARLLKERYTTSEYNIDFARDVLLEPRFDLGETGEILIVAGNPRSARDELYKRKNYEFLLNEFRRVHGASEPSELAVQMIESIGRTVDVRYNPREAVGTIHEAEVVGNEARRYLHELQTTREQLVQSGVDPQRVDQYVGFLEEELKIISSRRSVYTLKEAAGKLKEMVSGIRHDIRKQQCQHWVANFVRANSESEQAGMVPFLIRRHDLINVSYEQQGAQIRATLRQFSLLDSDLQHDVLIGLSRLDSAIRRQSQRRVVKPAPAVRVDQSSPAEARTLQRDVAQDIGQRPLAQQVPVPAELTLVIDKAEVERRRQRINNERLKSLAEEAKIRIGEIDLDPKEYDLTTLQVLKDLIKLLGQKLVEHPDILRTHKEWKEYKNREIKERETRVIDDLEQSQRETRTGH